MTASRQQLLERLVALHETQQQPVSARALASEVDLQLSVVEDHLNALEECHLVKKPGDNTGYAPTITAHELLALDIDKDGLVVVDCDEN